MNNDFTKGRRKFVKSAFTVASALAIAKVAPTWAVPQGRSFKDQILTNDEIDLTIAKSPLLVGNKVGTPITINGQMPGPLIRLKEGQRAKLNVINRLLEDTSIHWHGIILPENMDGVPGVSFEGIKPGRTFKYRYDVEQNGTYWYHSHSGLQEQLGHLGPLVIEPKDGDIGADREHTIILSDWTFEDPDTVFRNLKVAEGYYNYQKRTIFETFEDVRQQGLEKTWKQREMWGQMRMSPRDIADVTGSTYTYLMNGRDSQMNWSALFKPGEKVRLRIINGSAMSFFDVRIPGLEMTVVAADGQPVKPVPVDEFRIGVAETYDVIVQPKQNKPYTIYAESFDRSGYVRGTLTPELGLEAEVPELRQAPERGMAAMGMGAMAMSGDMKGNSMNMKHMGGNNSHMTHKMTHKRELPVENIKIKHRESGHGAGAAMIATNPVSRLHEPGIGLEDVEHKVLLYTDLIGAHEWPDTREPERQIELHLTGNMERYMWSFDGKKFTEVDGPVQFHHGERLRLVMVNDTMMDHPIHLHGMWMELENGQYPRPRKHTISLKPNEKVSLLITADAPGSWAFHCHLLYHMKAGMFRVVNVA
ncbi:MULTISPECIES: copper resistance system multicopper oxidase [Pseudoalteromonas]|uniref:Copper resistance protein CopA n=1 Tax=Pseudoalteromonas ruthenica TaxID=151081 RepID=A0A0F4PWL4_9GAMM|nr:MULTISPECIES: copper resistance system multicopper oxidase [Pseudoalteromonas]KJY97157.1 copper resistance protein CopA [Pseudoalteromonas ruthenica]KJY99469.1 copper resistance protein CopA [Pseudoalteromonas ruthenica]RZF84872.1 copper resistance system multicopper oxidase [Pseudoalteromonas sp. CO325X]TMO86835.1 copper resistance system multicopper oxidase [Pseudoalteromonas ruthenica]TMO93453.1 copper resistance system multicopper oxidase [Pseudoalteromonas ruthenica]